MARRSSAIPAPLPPTTTGVSPSPTRATSTARTPTSHKPSRSIRNMHSRGVDDYLMGQLPKALADLTQANALNPTAPYVALALDIVAVRSGLPSSLRDASAKIDMTAWPA